MTLADLIPIALKTSIFLTVFGFALETTLDDATYLFRSPGKLLRTVFSMNVVMLVVAVVLAKYFDLNPAVKVSLVALAVSPVPPILPNKIFKGGGGRSYTIGLLTAAAVLALVLIPLSLEIVGRIFDLQVGMPVGKIAVVVLVTVLVPLLAGIIAHSLAPSLADTIAKPISRVATILLILSAVPLFISAGPAMWSLIGNGTIVAIVVFVAIGLVAGHSLGGPDPDDRRILALSTTARHPGIAIGIAQASFPELKLAFAAVLLYLIVSAIVTLPYQKWFQGKHSARDAATRGLAR